MDPWQQDCAGEGCAPGGQAALPVVERFVSINGEGARAGQLAAFIRLHGCNLRCNYCDTTWANAASCPFAWESVTDLVEYVRQSGVACVTLTGGEPLLHAGSSDLLGALVRKLPGVRVEVETNGSVDLGAVCALRAKLPATDQQRMSFTMDVKLPGSGEGRSLHVPNLQLLQPWDSVKFVAGSREDLDAARALIAEHGLDQRTQVFLSPVFGRIEPAAMVDYMKAKGLANVRLQLQMHKVIWPPDARGV